MDVVLIGSWIHPVNFAPLEASEVGIHKCPAWVVISVTFGVG